MEKNNNIHLWIEGGRNIKCDLLFKNLFDLVTVKDISDEIEKLVNFERLTLLAYSLSIYGENETMFKNFSKYDEFVTFLKDALEFSEGIRTEFDPSNYNSNYSDWYVNIVGKDLLFDIYFVDNNEDSFILSSPNKDVLRDLKLSNMGI